MAGQIEQDFGGRLDVLVSNAGVALENVPPSQTDLEKFKATHLTNAFGPLVVTKAMLPLLKRSAAGRVVNVSSSLGSRTLNRDPSSKYAGVRLVAHNSLEAALKMQTVLFAGELAAEGSPLKVNSACPGSVATDPNDHQGHRTVEEGAREPVRPATAGERSKRGDGASPERLKERGNHLVRGEGGRPARRRRQFVFGGTGLGQKSLGSPEGRDPS